MHDRREFSRRELAARTIQPAVRERHRGRVLYAGADRAAHDAASRVPQAGIRKRSHGRADRRPGGGELLAVRTSGVRLRNGFATSSPHQGIQGLVVESVSVPLPERSINRAKNGTCASETSLSLAPRTVFGKL